MTTDITFTARDHPESRAKRLNLLQTRVDVLEEEQGLAPAGSGTEIVASAVVDISMVSGLPVVVDRANGKLTTALASTKTKAFLAGLLEEATAGGHVGKAVRGPVTLNDWTSVAGTASLSPGQTYFLGVTGGITTTAPTSPNCTVVVGIAASTTVLMVDPSLPLQL